MRRARLLCCLLLCCLPAACSIDMNLPTDFLRLEQGGVEYKAITPDDGRLWVRAFVNEGDGTLQFWSTTLQNDLVDKRGYELVGTAEVKDGDGNVGTQLECRTVANGERYGYLVSVFVTPGSLLAGSRVVVAEFTAREAVFTDRLDAVRQAIATLHP